MRLSFSDRPTTFNDYLEHCYLVPYDRVAAPTCFGKPMNCYGFVYWYYKLCRGIELDRDGVESVADIHHVRYEKVMAPTNGDVVDIRTMDGTASMHVGIYMDGCVYHFNEQGLQSKDVFRMTHSIKGFYHVIED